MLFAVVDLHSEILKALRSDFLHVHAAFGEKWLTNGLATPSHFGLIPPLWEILDRTKAEAKANIPFDVCRFYL